MPYQKLQTSRAWAVVTSDDADIPNISLAGPTGTADAITTNYLVDTSENFVSLGVRIGMVVVNTSGTPTISYVGGFATNTEDNDSILLVDNNGAAVDNFPLGTETYAIFGKPIESATLYVGAVGNVAVVTAGGDSVTFVGVPAGTFLPVHIRQVLTTGTTATDMVALW